VPGETVLPGGKLVARTVDRRNFDLEGFLRTKNPLTEVLDARLLNPLSPKPKAQSPKPAVLVCRTRKPGDRFRPFGSAGTKKLKAFLIDRKLPRLDRDQLPLLALEGSSFLVPGSWSSNQELVTGNQPLDTARGPEPAEGEQPLVLWVVGLRLSEHARVPPDAEKLVVMEYVPEEVAKEQG
jgi:tRNA(Ile)-lysidine synthetase-like protein